jgi:hypothetical protein
MKAEVEKDIYETTSDFSMLYKPQKQLGGTGCFEIANYKMQI